MFNRLKLKRYGTKIWRRYRSGSRQRPLFVMIVVIETQAGALVGVPLVEHW